MLTRTGRSIEQIFRRQEGEPIDLLLATMDKIKNRYEPKAKVGAVEVPYLAEFRIGLNVASCDNQPLVVVRTSSSERRASIERELAAPRVGSGLPGAVRVRAFVRWIGARIGRGCSRG